MSAETSTSFSQDLATTFFGSPPSTNGLEGRCGNTNHAARQPPFKKQRAPKILQPVSRPPVIGTAGTTSSTVPAHETALLHQGTVSALTANETQEHEGGSGEAL